MDRIIVLTPDIFRRGILKNGEVDGMLHRPESTFGNTRYMYQNFKNVWIP